MHSNTIRITAFILLISHTLMSCNNLEVGLPSQPHHHGEKTKQLYYSDLVDYEDLQAPKDTPVVLTSADGQLINFTCKQGDWQASISLAEDFSSIEPSQELAVRYEPGYTPRDLATYSLNEQKQFIHLVPSEEDTTQPGYVYLGREHLGSQSVTNQVISSPLPQPSTQAPVLLQDSPRVDLPAPKPNRLQAKNRKRTSISSQHTTSLHRHHTLQQEQQKARVKREKGKEVIRKEACLHGDENKDEPQADEQPTVVAPIVLGSQALILRQSPGSMMQARCMQGYPIPGQLACRQAIPWAPTIRTREGHQVSLIQDAGYWWGMVRRGNCSPGYSANLMLPVLYPQGLHVTTLGGQLQHTIEALLNAPTELQRSILRVVLPEQTPHKQGFIYTGRAMELVGGVIFEVLLMGAAIGAGIYALYKIGHSIITLASIIIKNHLRKIERDKILTNLSRLISDVTKEEEKIENAIETLINKMDDDPQSYKIIKQILDEIKSHKEYIRDNINKLEDLKKSDCLSEEDIIRINDHIKARERMLEHIDQRIEDAKKKARKQALAAFKKKQDKSNRKTQTISNQLKNAIKFIASPNALTPANENFQTLMKRIEKNINFYEAFKKEPALFPEDLELIDNLIKQEKEKRTETLLLGELIEYTKKNAIEIQIIANSTTEEVKKHAVTAIKTGQLFKLNYLILYKGLSVYDVVWGKTLLEYAKAAGKRDIEDYLLKRGVNK